MVCFSSYSCSSCREVSDRITSNEACCRSGEALREVRTKGNTAAMPFIEPIKQNRGVDVDSELEREIKQVLKSLDAEIEELSRAQGLNRANVRFLLPLHVWIVVKDTEVLVVSSVNDHGGVPFWRVLDYSNQPFDLEMIHHLVEDGLGFPDPFSFHFPRSLLFAEEESRREDISSLASKCIDFEIERMEKLKRIVKIEPIFQGRDFTINEELVFVLMPFDEPFDEVFEDHIRPTVNKIDGLRCMRADDIYDNREIMEAIWRFINEARIIIAELTGRNPNVFYETGIAHTVGKEVILITQSMEDVPFDLRHLRCIVYQRTARGCKRLEQDLENMIRAILARVD